MTVTVGQLAELIGGTVDGDSDVELTGLGGLRAPGGRLRRQ